MLIRIDSKVEISVPQLDADDHSTDDDPVQSEFVSCNLFAI